jgi:hypothetical protein
MSVTPASAAWGKDAPHQESPRQTFRTKGFRYADRCFNRAVQLASAVHEGFWLGCLSADELNAITATHYGENQFYTSNDHNLSGLSEWESEALARYFRPASRVLVAAAGAGREVLALRKAGFDARGFECSLPLVTASQRIFNEFGEPNTVTHWPVDSVPPGQGAYDGLILGWGAYTHIPTKERRIAFLNGLRGHIPSQSPLILSFFTRTTDSVYDRAAYRTARICRFFLGGTEDALEHGDRIEWSRFVHRFTRDELELEVTSAGFRVERYDEERGSGHAIAISE